MRTPLIAGNWKMFKTVHEAVVYTKEFRTMVKDVTGVEIVVAPPFLAVHAVAEAARNSPVAVAAQDVFWEKEGAFTGEVSAAMVREAGAEYVIVGHSERRQYFGETDQSVNRKTVAALGADLIPIVCIGETLDERERNETMDVLDRQIKQGLDGLTGAQVAGLVIAYEPVWAIGTGRTATSQQAQEVHEHIRRRLRAWFGGDAADGCHVLYGGSVKPDNIAELIAQPDVDGALVGGREPGSAKLCGYCAQDEEIAFGLTGCRLQATDCRWRPASGGRCRWAALAAGAGFAHPRPDTARSLQPLVCSLFKEHPCIGQPPRFDSSRSCSPWASPHSGRPWRGPQIHSRRRASRLYSTAATSPASTGSSISIRARCGR